MMSLPSHTIATTGVPEVMYWIINEKTGFASVSAPSNVSYLDETTVEGARREIRVVFTCESGGWGKGFDTVVSESR